MLRKSALAILAIVVILAAGPACQGGGKNTGLPVEDLIAAGQPLVVAGPMVKGASPIAPTFTMSLTNASNAPIAAVGGTVIFFDAEGKALLDTVADAGYAEVAPIPPGGKIEMRIMAQNEKAVSGKWILKDALYEKTNPMGREYGTLPYKWSNPGYGDALQAERAK
ncbi:MAG: hypothetical protein PHI34_05195 [Acidobacteriota bacterium]|nr:hypothetical protein [Acidobacteriota bacterium]